MIFKILYISIIISATIYAAYIKEVQREKDLFVERVNKLQSNLDQNGELPIFKLLDTGKLTEKDLNLRRHGEYFYFNGMDISINNYFANFGYNNIENELKNNMFEKCNKGFNLDVSYNNIDLETIYNIECENSGGNIFLRLTFRGHIKINNKIYPELVSVSYFENTLNRVFSLYSEQLMIQNYDYQNVMVCDLDKNNLKESYAFGSFIDRENYRFNEFYL